MKIVHIVEGFGGGVFTFIKDIVKGDTANEHIIIHGLTKNVILDKNNDLVIDEELKGNDTKFIPWKSVVRELSITDDVRAYNELKKIIRNIRDVDVFHLHSSKAGALGRLVLRSKNVLYTPHAISFLRKDISYFKKNIFILLEKFLNIICNSKIVACSESEMQEINRYGLNSICIPNGIKKRERYSSESQKKYDFVTVGRLCEQKGIDLFARIARENPELSFLWIGDGELKSKIIGVENITLTGWLDHLEVKKFLDKSKVYISTARWEGLPLAVIEAMSSSMPLLLSNCVGNIDLVNSFNGIIYSDFDDLKEQILKISKFTESNLNNMGHESYELFSKKFTWERMFDEYQNLYKQLSCFEAKKK